MQKNSIEQLLKKSSDIICTINTLGEFIWVNNNAKIYFGFQNIDPKTKLFSDQFIDENQSDFQNLLIKIKSEPSQELIFNSRKLLHDEARFINWILIWTPEEDLFYCLAIDKTLTNILEKNDDYQMLFDNSPCSKMIYSSDTFQFLDVNDSALTAYGYTKKEFLKLNLKDLTSTKDFLEFELAHKDLLQKKESKYLGIYTHLKHDGSLIKMEMAGQNSSLNNETDVILTCIDVTERVQKYELEKLEHDIMEKALEVELDLHVLFGNYIKGLGKIFPEMKASILKVEDGKVWNFVSSLPASYSNAINGQPIGPKEGSCGTAAFLKKRIISADINTDPLWTLYKSLALPLGLKSCWSQPIFNSKKEVIATFANYFNTARKPTVQELEIFERSASMIGIIFENQAKSQELQSKIEQFNYVNQATKDAIYDRDIKLDTIEWGLSYQSLFGHKLQDIPYPLSKWKSLVHPKDLPRILVSLSEFYNDPTNDRWQVKYRFKKADGTFAFVEDKGYAIRDKRGKAIRLIGVLSDISINRLEDLKKEVIAGFTNIFNNTKELKSALDQITKMLLVYGGYSISELWLLNSNKSELNLYSKSANANGDIFYASNNIRNLKFGEGLPGIVWEKEQIVSWNYKELSNKMERRKSALGANLKNLLGVPLIRKGELIGVWLCAESHEDSSTFNTTEKIGLELGANLASEINRKQLEEGLSHIFQLAPDIICTLDYNGDFRRINKAGCELLEYSEDELLQMSYNQLEHTSNTGVLSESAQVFYDQGKTYRNENKYITKSGKVLWLDWNCRTSVEEGLIYAVAKDITEKKKLQNLLNDASNLAVLGSWEINITDKSIYWSNTTKAIHEAPKDYIPDLETAIKFYREDVRDQVHHTINEAIKNGVEWDFELPINTYKNNEKWVRCIGRPHFTNNKCTSIHGSFQDITEHKITELKLKTTLLEKKEILERINDAFFAVDKKFIVTYWNSTAEEFTNTPKDSILGINLWEVFADAVDLPSFRIYNEALRTGEAKQFEDFYAPVNRWFDISVYPSKTGLSVYFKDISQKKQAEEKIKMTNELLKDIAWQQSHSVRAPVARLMAIVDLIQNGGLELCEKKDLFKEIINSSKEIDAIIRDISKKTNKIDFK